MSEPVRRAQGYTLFPTAIGQCAIAWTIDGILSTQLPERTSAATTARIRRHTGNPDAAHQPMPGFVHEAISRIAAVTRGADDDLTTVPIDITGLSTFTTDVFKVARAIRPGTTMTYGNVARHAGRPNGARAVGTVMGSNPLPIIVPCHRVVAASGKVGGFSAAAGPELKIRMLHTERTSVEPSEPPYDLNAAAEHLADADPNLAEVIESVGPPTLRPRTVTTLFADLAEAIVHQQLSNHVGAILHARLCATMPQPLDGPTPSGLLQAADATLIDIGLSKAKIGALRSLTEAAYSGRLPTDTELDAMTDDEIIDAVTAVWGVGNWTAQTMLILRLCRPDVFVADDVAIRNAIERIHPLNLADGQAGHVEIAERWRPHRSLACWYLWQHTALAQP